MEKKPKKRMIVGTNVIIPYSPKLAAKVVNGFLEPDPPKTKFITVKETPTK